MCVSPYSLSPPRSQTKREVVGVLGAKCLAPTYAIRRGVCATGVHHSPALPTTLHHRPHRSRPLFLSCLLHQTTTYPNENRPTSQLFLSCLLHQTTTSPLSAGRSRRLFLSCLLHQTTTLVCLFVSLVCCFSLVFYIKPQLITANITKYCVVSLLSSTSNHNSMP